MTTRAKEWRERTAALAAERNLVSREEWAAMSDSDRIKAVRENRVGREFLKQALTDGSDELKDAASEALAPQVAQAVAITKAAIHGNLQAMEQLSETIASETSALFKNLRIHFIVLAREAIPEIEIGGEVDLIAAIRKARPQWGITDETPLNQIVEWLYSEAEHRRQQAQVATPHRKRTKPPTLPTTIPQQTWTEARNMAIAYADGPSLRGWEEIVGEVALRHSREGDPVQIKLVAGSSLNWFGAPATYDHLTTELRDAGVDAALLLNEAINLALMPDPVSVPIDALINAVGLDPRSTSERKECRKWVWRMLLLFENTYPIGQRRGSYPDPDNPKKKVPVVWVDRIIEIGPRLMAEQLALDNSEPPYEVVIKPSLTLARFRGNRQILPDYGDVRRIATIPSRQPSGRWARSVGLTINQLLRQDSHKAKVTRPGEDNKLTVRYPSYTRRELLTKYFAATPPVMDILNGDHPGRAREYWDGALQHLKKAGIIDNIKPLKSPKNTSKEEWLDQPLKFVPNTDSQLATVEIARATANARRGRKTKK